MKRHIFLVLALLAILSAPVLAATAAPPAAQAIEIPLPAFLSVGIIEAIFTLLTGYTLRAVVEWVKKKFKITGGLKAAAVSLAASVGCTAYVLLQVSHSFTWIGFIGYSLATFGVASGWFTVKPKTT